MATVRIALVNRREDRIQGTYKDGSKVEFHSPAEAADTLKCSATDILTCMATGRKCKGYKWERLSSRRPADEEWRSTARCISPTVYQYKYKVSNYGLVLDNFKRAVEEVDGKVLLQNRNGETEIEVPLLVMLAFEVRQPHPRAKIRHKDGNPDNNHLNNLEWV